MTEENKIQLFENSPIRSAWDTEKEEWLFSVVDIVAILTEQKDTRGAAKYWNTLKTRLRDEGSELSTKCRQLKLKAKDGKARLTDVADTEQILRIIQSIPSKKAEPIKLWLAEVGKDRIEENIDPEKAIERAAETYLRQGYKPNWINQRLQSISVRNDLTNEWRERGIKKGREYALLTDELTKAWSGMTTREYKSLKGLKKESLRDNMSTTELVLNMLAETATKEFTQANNALGFNENKKAAKQGGGIAGDARKNLEKQLGHPVTTKKNAAELNHTITKMIEASVEIAEEEQL